MTIVIYFRCDRTTVWQLVHLFHSCSITSRCIPWGRTESIFSTATDDMETKGIWEKKWYTWYLISNFSWCFHAKPHSNNVGAECRPFEQCQLVRKLRRIAYAPNERTTTIVYGIGGGNAAGHLRPHDWKRPSQNQFVFFVPFCVFFFMRHWRDAFISFETYPTRIPYLYLFRHCVGWLVHCRLTRAMEVASGPTAHCTKLYRSSHNVWVCCVLPPIYAAKSRTNSNSNPNEDMLMGRTEAMSSALYIPYEVNDFTLNSYMTLVVRTLIPISCEMLSAQHLPRPCRQHRWMILLSLSISFSSWISLSWYFSKFKIVVSPMILNYEYTTVYRWLPNMGYV